jgi:hypothetical protein
MLDYLSPARETPYKRSRHQASQYGGRCPDRTGARPRFSRITLRFEFRQLVEVTVVMRDLEPVELRTREDEQVRQGNRHAR